jgi:hypothetical protein
VAGFCWAIIGVYLLTETGFNAIAANGWRLKIVPDKKPATNLSGKKFNKKIEIIKCNEYQALFLGAC